MFCGRVLRCSWSVYGISFCYPILILVHEGYSLKDRLGGGECGSWSVLVLVGTDYLGAGEPKPMWSAKVNDDRGSQLSFPFMLEYPPTTSNCPRCVGLPECCCGVRGHVEPKARNIEEEPDVVRMLHYPLHFRLQRGFAILGGGKHEL